MTRHRRTQHWRRLWIAATLAALSFGCGADSSSAGRSPTAGTGGTAGAAGTAGDAGGAGGAGGASGAPEGNPPFSDGVAGFESNPIDQLLADPDRDPSALLGTDAQGGGGYVETAVACYSEPGACTAPDCTAFASCCVATGRCGKPLDQTPLPDALFFDQCAGQTVDTCAQSAGSVATVFGAQEPVLTDRGLVPNGSPTSEGGALLGDVVDLGSIRVIVDFQFALPVGCDGVCLESAGVAFSKDAGANQFAGAEVGLLLSGSREVVSLIIGGQVAAAYDAGPGSSVWRLALSPNGVVEVTRDGVRQGAYPFDVEQLREARLAVFGRNLVADSNSAAVAWITTQAELTDNPRVWTERFPMIVTVDGNVDPTLMMGSEPSLAAGPQLVTVAFELDGQIFIGEADDAGQVSFSAPGPLPAVFPTEDFEAGGVDDPELVWLLDSLFVFYTAYDQNGVGRIASATVSDGVAQKGLAPILEPEGNVISYESPTVVYRAGLFLMVVKATSSSGATELHSFYSPDPQTGWARIVDGALEELTRVDDPTEEITSPSLIVHNSAYQLYYARRRGTRWSIELAVSDELVLWRPLGESLGASGEGFDAMGARGADALSVNDAVEMVYVGQDGVGFHLGFASRPAPSDTAAR